VIRTLRGLHGSQQGGQSVFLSFFPSSLGYTRAANEAESVVQLAHCAQMVVVACSSALVPAGRTVYASPHLRLIIFHYHQSERMPTDQCILLARFGRDAWLGLASRPPKTAPEETSELAGEHVAGCADVSAAARPPRHTGMAGVNDDGATPLFFFAHAKLRTNTLILQDEAGLVKPSRTFKGSAG
jgi:hypothetical protein